MRCSTFCESWLCVSLAALVFCISFWFRGLAWLFTVNLRVATPSVSENRNNRHPQHHPSTVTRCSGFHSCCLNVLGRHSVCILTGRLSGCPKKRGFGASTKMLRYPGLFLPNPLFIIMLLDSTLVTCAANKALLKYQEWKQGLFLVYLHPLLRRLLSFQSFGLLNCFRFVSDASFL
jgi:hypothetical protein